MSLDWQTISALAIVFLASLFLLRRSVKKLSRDPGGCGYSCQGCDTEAQKGWVSADSLTDEK